MSKFSQAKWLYGGRTWETNMKQIKENRFAFSSLEAASGITVLQAVMSDFSYGMHAHEEFAIGVTRQGVQSYLCNGRRINSQPGHIILFNPGDAHNGNPGSRDALEYTMLYLDPEVLSGLIKGVSREKCGQLRIGENHFEDPLLRDLILDLSGAVCGNGKYGALEYEFGLYRIAAALAKKNGNFTPCIRKEKVDTLFTEVLAYMDAHLETEVTIEALSRVAMMSKHHFIRLFRSQFGLPPHRYILNCRVNRAREALADGLPPTDVAHQFGFYDASHLNRHFKRSYGITPKQYQMQLCQRGA